MREGYEDSLDVMRDRFESAMKKSRDEQESARDEMQARMNDMVNNQVKSQEAIERDAKSQALRDEVQVRQRIARELANYKNDFKKSMDDMQGQVNKAVESGNDRNRDDINNVKHEMGRQLVDTNRFYRDKMSEQNRIQKNAYQTIKGDYEARMEQAKSVADERVKKIFEESAEEKTISWH